MALNQVNLPADKLPGDGGKLKAFADWVGIATNIANLAANYQNMTKGRQQPANTYNIYTAGSMPVGSK